MCLLRLAVVRSLYTSAPPCRTFTVHARSTRSYVHCTRLLHAVVRSLYTSAPRGRTFSVHARSTRSYVLCTRPLHAVVLSLYTSAPRGRTFSVHARSTRSYVHCTRPLHAVIRSMYTPAPYTHALRCRIVVVTVQSVVPQCLPSASPVTDLIVCVQCHFRQQCYGYKSLLSRAAGGFYLYIIL